jgi:hypothetical protein
VTTPVWATVDDVTDALGTAPTDVDHLDACVAAANTFAWRRRAAAGYVDDETVSPGPDVTMGVTMYAVALYKERGTVDSYASFEAYAAGAVPPSTLGQVLRLLAVPKPAIDRPPTAEQLALRRLRVGIR